MQVSQLSRCQVVEKSGQLCLPQLTMCCQCLLQGPTVNKQEFDVGGGLFVLNFILQVRCQNKMSGCKTTETGMHKGPQSMMHFLLCLRI